MKRDPTPQELADELGIPREEVVRICVEESVPIYHGRVHRSVFEGVRIARRRCACGVLSGKISVCPDCQKQKYDGFNRTGGKGHKGFLAVVDERRALHLLKSGGYGTGDDPFANFTAVAAASGDPRYLYPILRSIEKLTRCLSLHAQGRVDELGEEFTDISSLMDCAEAMRREDASPSRPKPS